MDDGIVQLLFVLILIFAAMLDVVARGKRKRRGQTGELPPEEEARPRPPVRSPPTAEPTQGRGAPSGNRETADTMVPDDLWAILTGEAPPPRRGPRPREPEAEPWSAEGDAWTGEGVPYPRDAESTEPETWPTEVAVEELPPAEPPAEVLPDDERRRPAAPPRWALAPTGFRAPLTPARITPTSARSITTRVGASAPLAVRGGGRSPASRYTDLLRTGGVESLRTAVVLREVLDPPVALRGFRGGWD